MSGLRYHGNFVGCSSLKVFEEVLRDAKVEIEIMISESWNDMCSGRG